MSRQAADHEPGDYASLGEWLRNSGLSTKGQQAVNNAVVDSMIEGATPDRESVQRLIELAAGRITIDEFTSQVLKTADVNHVADEPFRGLETPGQEENSATLPKSSASTHTT